jgi:Putative MetA-pathway of phenol degradation
MFEKGMCETSKAPGRRVRLMTILIVAALCFILGTGVLWAGPPFFTDDPETPEYRHGELYIASQYAKGDEGKSGTAPHFEFNYSALPDVMLHTIIPLAWNKPNEESSKYGLGDIELGVLYRFIHESDTIPQVGAFPTLTVPTGDEDRGLGEGRARLFLPLWFKKSRGPWSSYAGGGYWINPGDNRKNYWFAGWQVQRELSEWLAVGAEIFYVTADTEDGGDSSGFNVGAILNLTEQHHLLFSIGQDIHGPNDLATYVGYQFTFGP